MLVSGQATSTRVTRHTAKKVVFYVTEPTEVQPPNIVEDDFQLADAVAQRQIEATNDFLLTDPEDRMIIEDNEESFSCFLCTFQSSTTKVLGDHLATLHPYIFKPSVSKKIKFEESLEVIENENVKLRQKESETEKSKVEVEMQPENKLNDQIFKFNLHANSLKQSGINTESNTDPMKHSNNYLPNVDLGSSNSFERNSEIVHFKQSDFSCTKCSSAFKEKQDLNLHLLSHHFNNFGETAKTNGPNIANGSNTGEKPKCKICLKIFSSMKSLKWHLKIIHSMPKEDIENMVKIATKNAGQATDISDRGVHLNEEEKPDADLSGNVTALQTDQGMCFIKTEEVKSRLEKLRSITISKCRPKISEEKIGISPRERQLNTGKSPSSRSHQLNNDKNRASMSESSFNVCQSGNLAFNKEQQQVWRHIALGHSKTKIVQKIFSCRVCNKSFHEKRNLSKHFSLAHSNNNHKYDRVKIENVLNEDILQQPNTTSMIPTSNSSIMKHPQLSTNVNNIVNRDVEERKKVFSTSETKLSELIHKRNVTNPQQTSRNINIIQKSASNNGTLQRGFIAPASEPKSLTDDVCKICDRKFYDNRSLRRHVAFVHPSNNNQLESSNICTICNKPLAHKWSLKRHLKEVHQNSTREDYLCKESNELPNQISSKPSKESSNETINNSRKRALGESVIPQDIDRTCSNCHKQFTSVIDLKKHFAICIERSSESFLTNSTFDVFLDIINWIFYQG